MNKSPQFPKHSAHDVHSGRAGGNKLDPKAGAAIATDLLSRAKSGEIKIISLSPQPPKGQDPIVWLTSVNQKIEDGSFKLKGVRSHENAVDGEKRSAGAVISYLDGKGHMQQLDVDYELA